MVEVLKSLGRCVVRAYMRMPIRGKGRLLVVARRWLAPIGSVENRRVGCCSIGLNHNLEATMRMAYGVYEAREVRALRRIVKRGDAVVDVGANVGYLAAHLSEVVGSGGRVFAFEPAPTALGVLRETARSSSHQNIEVVAAAVSNRNGKAAFFETEAGISKGYSRIDRRPSERFARIVEIAVPAIRLDEFLAERMNGRRLSFIKIDVEGHERQCIEGLSGLFASGFRPSLMVEATGTDEGLSEIGEIGKSLVPLGYSLFDLNLHPLEELRPGFFHRNILWVA